MFRRMTSIRNLPLAARLGGAFGALCLMLAIVAFTGVHSMNGVRSSSDDLANRQLPIAQLIGGLQQRAKSNMSLVGQHLYVNDGDLAAQDKIEDELKANWAKNKAAAPKLGKLVEGTPIASHYAEYSKLRDVFVATQKRAVALSRKETVENAEERDGSRGLFTGELLKA